MGASIKGITDPGLLTPDQKEMAECIGLKHNSKPGRLLWRKPCLCCKTGIIGACGT